MGRNITHGDQALLWSSNVVPIGQTIWVVRVSFAMRLRWISLVLTFLVVDKRTLVDVNVNADRKRSRGFLDINR